MRTRDLDDTPGNPSLLSDLARTLLGHLDEEEDALRETTATLECMHQALRGANLEKLRTAQVEQESLAGRLERLRGVRRELLGSLGRALGTEPAGLTIRCLAARLPSPLAQRLNDARERTQHLANKAESLNRQNAVLAMHCLSFVQGCLSDLYGEASVAARYSAAGRAVEAPRGSLLERQG